MNDYNLTTPVAFFIFNRPEPAARVFETIRKAKPRKLLIVADGPRINKPGEKQKCEETRNIVSDIDWDCEVIKNFSDLNLGCKSRISSGITWVFENAEEAILLEDDCVPHPSFFRYCGELLERYRHDERIMLISGSNFQNGRKVSEDSYYFSSYNHIWGWASWRRAWQKYDITMKHWPEIRKKNFLNYWLTNKKAVEHWEYEFDVAHENKIDTWDIQLVYSCWINSGLTILPNVNLVENIGFGHGATHTHDTGNKSANIPAGEMHFPLKHPPIVMRNPEADRYEEDHFMVHSFLGRQKRRLKKLLGRY